MTARSMDQARAGGVRQVSDLLESLAGELDALVNPQRMALRLLGVEPLGWTRLAYAPEAFKIWQSLVASHPDDWEALHHLAIAHHARAIELDAGDQPRQSDRDWAAALELWHRLWQCDAFWNYIAEIACKHTKRTAVEQLRSELPVLLLQIHFDIACEPDIPLYRAAYHIKTALEAPFPPEAIETVRAQTYQRFIADVPANVWQIDMLDPTTIKIGTDRIQQYLALDPGCTVALADALRLQVRLLRTRNQELQALGQESSGQRLGLLGQMKDVAEYWLPYFDQLAAVAECLDDDVRERLCLWYRVSGDVLWALDRKAEAVHYYEQGTRAGIDDEGRKQCAASLGETRAYLARELAYHASPDAKPQCDRLAAEAGLSIQAHFLLANAYVLLREFDAAAAVCQRGLQLELDVSETDFEVIEAFTRDRGRLQDYLGAVERGRNRQGIRWVLDQAAAHIEESHYADALPLLEVALREAPGDDEVFYLQGQCRLGMDLIDEAYADLAEFRRRGGDAEAADRLQRSLDDRATDVRRFGREALGLRGQAAEQFALRDYARANELLCMALSVCADGGRQAIGEQKAIVLLTMAQEEFERVVDQPSRTVEDRRAACRAAVDWLEEARRLDAASAAVERRLRMMRDVLRRFEPQPAHNEDELPQDMARSIRCR